MPRPRYETESDRRRESKVAERFASNFNDVTVEKMPHGDRADFLVMRNGKKSAYMEIKTRTCTSRQYATYHVSKDKLTSLAKQAQKDSIAALLLVQWRDRLGYISVKKFLDNASYRQGGRWDRNDPFDVEEMAEVDINLFTFLN